MRCYDFLEKKVLTNLFVKSETIASFVANESSSSIWRQTAEAAESNDIRYKHHEVSYQTDCLLMKTSFRISENFLGRASRKGKCAIIGMSSTRGLCQVPVNLSRRAEVIKEPIHTFP